MGTAVASVLVASVGRGDGLDRLLGALARQIGDVACEVIVADRRGPGEARRIRRDHPNVRILVAPAGTPIPALRAMALAASSGRYIFVTEDHTIPPANWIARFVAELEEAPEHVAAVGGCVANALCDGSVDWAAFLCEYAGYLPPRPGGDADDLPGMNIAYRRDVLVGLPEEVLQRSFWETTVHPRLLADGYRFRRIADVVVAHRKHFGFVEFCVQRFHYSRQFAGLRFARLDVARRLGYAAGSLLLPVLILVRTGRVLPRGRPGRRTLLRCLPAMACFSVAWAAGEAVGYLAGPGGSLARVE